MPTRHRLAAAALACAFPAGASSSATPAADPRPNLLVIVLDDVGIDHVALYDEGPPEHQPKTPSLDALAREGIHCTNAYSQPLCSPTRATFLTGRYGFRTGITDILGQSGLALGLDEWTLPQALRERGYTCVMLGKWHLGLHGERLLDPVLHGYEAFQGTVGNLRNYRRFPEWTAWPWIATRATQPAYGPTQLTDVALGLLEKLPEPWCLVVSHHLAHRPVHVPPTALHSYGPDPGDEQHRFMAMVQALDHEVGRLLSRVDRKDTTIVAFGDNGTEHQFSEYDLAKGTVYEAGVNVPLMLAGAGVEARGARCESLVQVVDLFATLVELGGGTSRAEDSVSLVPLLQDPQRRVRDWVYSELEGLDPEDPLRPIQQMVREDRYKLMRVSSPLGEIFERFFDLGTAPPGGDGEALCWSPGNDCPAGLDDEERAAYEHLAHLLDTIREG